MGESTILEALDAKAREYMKRVIMEMVGFRKREAELLAGLIAKNTRRLQERLSRYSMVPRVVWSPRAVVTGGPVELPPAEPYRFRLRWPRPPGLEDAFTDTVSLFSPSFETAEIKRDDNLIYREKVASPSGATGEVEVLPKYPFFDNLAQSPAELLEQVQRYISHFVLEIVLDREVNYTDCARGSGSENQYYCRPSNLRYVNVAPGSYVPWAGVNVDFRVSPRGVPSVVLHDFYYHGLYSASNILYFTSDGNQYTISVTWEVLDGYYKTAEAQGGSATVYVSSVVVLVTVENSTPASVKFVALHVPGGVNVARFTYTDSQSNTTYIAMAFDTRFNSGVEITQRG